MWVPSASVYAMDAFHVKTQHNFKEHLILNGGSILITGGIGFVMRKISQHIEVSNTHDTQFPSGHAANVFRGAEIVHQELKESHPALSYKFMWWQQVLDYLGSIIRIMFCRKCLPVRVLASYLPNLLIGFSEK